MNIGRVLRCQRNHFLYNLWNCIQEHEDLRLYMFRKHKELYAQLRFFSVFGTWLNYRKITTFHEKLFWLSVKWRNPLIVQCADKVRVREYVKRCGCSDILNEVYGVYSTADEICFSNLPDKFVLKSNRGSGGNLFCINKNYFDKSLALIEMKEWEQNVYGIDTAEFQYFPMPFNILCEKYLIQNETDELVEYQLFCFNGRPDSFLVRNDLETCGKDPFAVSYSLDWHRLYLRKDEENFHISLPEPVNRGKMIEYATKLAKPFPHVRVDFYEINGRLYFGELTFSTHGNVFSNYKSETLEYWGALLQLPEPYKLKDRY